MEANSSKLAVTAILLVTIALAFSSTMASKADAYCVENCSSKTHSGGSKSGQPVCAVTSCRSSTKSSVTIPVVLVVAPKTAVTTITTTFSGTVTITLSTGTKTITFQVAATYCWPFDIEGFGEVGVEQINAVSTLYSTVYTTTISTATSVTSTNTFTTLTANTITTSTSTTVNNNTSAGNGAPAGLTNCNIPGFPLEGTMIGIAIGLIFIMISRSKSRRSNPRVRL